MAEDVTQRVNKFFSAYRRIPFSKGQLLLLPGDISDSVYYLQSGKVSVYDVSYKGDEIVLYTFMPCSYFPMASVINTAVNRFFYKADVDSIVRKAPSAKFKQFIASDPDMGFHLLSRAYERFDFILERMLHLISSTARNRLIFELIAEYTSFGVKDDDSGYIETHESEIAARAGLSRETVSREMRYLKDANLVRVGSHKIYILDYLRLERLLTR